MSRPFFGNHPRHLHRFMEPEFGMPVPPDGLVAAVVTPMLHRGFYKPWNPLPELPRDIGTNVFADKDKFEVNVDVQHFAPEELSVKVSNGFVVVEGNHEEKQDEHGFISRQFLRRYMMPDYYDPDTVESTLSSDGVLTIIARKKQAVALQNVRTVTISQTGPVRLDIKDVKKVLAKEPKQTDVNEPKRAEVKESEQADANGAAK